MELMDSALASEACSSASSLKHEIESSEWMRAGRLLPQDSSASRGPIATELVGFLPRASCGVYRRLDGDFA